MTIVVGPFYVANGPLWNDYVKANGTTRFDSTGAACDPATDGPTYTGCIHGGELRGAQVTGRATCGAMATTDTLGAFDWSCVELTGQAWVVSSALKPAKHLADLLDFATGAWRQNAITVMDGATVVATSVPAVWWTNPVRVLATGTTTATEHDILLTRAGATGQVSPGIVNKLAYVTEPGTTFTGTQVQLRGNFEWAEPRTTDAPFLGSDGAFFVVRGGAATGNTSARIQLIDLRASVIEDLTVTRTAGTTNAVQIRASGSKIARVTTSGPSAGIVLGSDTFPTVTGSTFEDLSNTGSSQGIVIANTTLSTFRRLTSIGATGNEAISVGERVSSSSFEDVTVRDAWYWGMIVWGRTSTYRHLRITGTGGHGFFLRTANSANRCVGNRILDLRMAENGRRVVGEEAISLACDWNVLQDVWVSNVGARGVEFSSDTINVRIANLYASGGDVLFSENTNSNGGGTVAQNLTLAGGKYDGTGTSFGVGVFVSSSAHKYLANVLTFNTNIGLLQSQVLSVAPRYRNLVSLGTAGGAVVLGANNRATFDGVLRLGADGATQACSVPANAVGLGDTCLNEAPSTATVTQGYLDTDVIVGPVTSDTANASDVSGSAAYAAGLDFMSFDTPQRTWGKSGAGLWPGIAQQGRCVTGDTCQIYDLSLRTSDLAARNVAPALPTGDDVVVMFDQLRSVDPVNQADCDTNSPGSLFVAGAPGHCESRFLRDAVEFLFDGIGDDDNLCESNETCLYSPNAGAYQGHGNLISAGTFTPGELTGVTLMKYDTNGR